MEEWLAEATRASFKLLQAFCLGLGMPPDALAPYFEVGGGAVAAAPLLAALRLAEGLGTWRHCWRWHGGRRRASGSSMGWFAAAEA